MNDGEGVLRARIRAAGIPPARPGNLRLATWNIRELGKGTRTDASVRMIAQILRAFDLVSVVELRDDLGDLARVMRALGPRFGVVFSDYLRDAGGNRERVAFVFDARRVVFTGLASNAEGARRRVGDGYRRELPWWRPPFLASFRAGRFDFVLIAAHVRWGPTARGRVGEVVALAEWIVSRTKERYFGDKDVLAVGDFNVRSTKASPAFEALRARGFALPPGLGAEADAATSVLAKGKRYDQVLFLPRYTTCFSGRAGVLDFYRGDHAALFPTRHWSKAKFTFQLSDHLPLWSELATRTRGEGLDLLRA